MKRLIFISVCIAFLGGISCSENNPPRVVNEDSLRQDSLDHFFGLEYLLDVPDINELEKRYGKDAVTFDTIWGAEGFFTMGTILKTEPQSHIEITWVNEETKTGIISVTQVSDADWYSDTHAPSEWRSISGVAIGITMEELQKINGRPFTFSGFGWDYAGGVHDWQKGKLEGRGIAVQLSEGPADKDMSSDEAAKILGDVEVQSDNATALKFHPRVWSISVAKIR